MMVSPLSCHSMQCTNLLGAVILAGRVDGCHGDCFRNCLGLAGINAEWLHDWSCELAQGIAHASVMVMESSLDMLQVIFPPHVVRTLIENAVREHSDSEVLEALRLVAAGGGSAVSSPSTARSWEGEEERGEEERVELEEGNVGQARQEDREQEDTVMQEVIDQSAPAAASSSTPPRAPSSGAYRSSNEYIISSSGRPSIESLAGTLTPAGTPSSIFAKTPFAQISARAALERRPSKSTSSESSTNGGPSSSSKAKQPSTARHRHHKKNNLREPLSSPARPQSARPPSRTNSCSINLLASSILRQASDPTLLFHQKMYDEDDLERGGSADSPTTRADLEGFEDILKDDREEALSRRPSHTMESRRSGGLNGGGAGGAGGNGGSINTQATSTAPIISTTSSPVASMEVDEAQGKAIATQPAMATTKPCPFILASAPAFPSFASSLYDTPIPTSSAVMTPDIHPVLPYQFGPSSSQDTAIATATPFQSLGAPLSPTVGTTQSEEAPIVATEIPSPAAAPAAMPLETTTTPITATATTITSPPPPYHHHHLPYQHQPSPLGPMGRRPLSRITESSSGSSPSLGSLPSIRSDISPISPAESGGVIPPPPLVPSSSSGGGGGGGGSGDVGMGRKERTMSLGGRERKRENTIDEQHPVAGPSASSSLYKKEPQFWDGSFKDRKMERKFQQWAYREVLSSIDIFGSAMWVVITIILTAAATLRSGGGNTISSSSLGREDQRAENINTIMLVMTACAVVVMAVPGIVTFLQVAPAWWGNVRQKWIGIQRFIIQLVVMFLMLQFPFISTYSTITTESSTSSSSSGDFASYSWLRIGAIGVLPLAAVTLTHWVPMQVHLPLGILSLWIMGVYAVMLVNQSRPSTSISSTFGGTGNGGGLVGTGTTTGTITGTITGTGGEKRRGDMPQVVLMVLMVQLIGGFLLPMVAINVMERRYRMKFLRLQQHMD